MIHILFLTKVINKDSLVVSFLSRPLCRVDYHKHFKLVDRDNFRRAYTAIQCRKCLKILGNIPF